MIFPYRLEDYWDRKLGSFVYVERPHIPVKLISPDGRGVVVPALVDSGADISFIGSVYAKFLEIDIKSGAFNPCQGLSGLADCFSHEGITIEISDGQASHRFEICADFAESWEHDFIILGRKDVFERFHVTIDEAKKQVELNLHKSEKGKTGQRPKT